MGNAVLIIILGSILLFGIANVDIYKKINKASESSIGYYSDVQARNICNSTMEKMLSKLFNEDFSYRTTSPVTIQLFGGKATYTITDVLLDGDSVVKVTVNADFNGTKRQSVTYTGSYGGWVPPYVRGAWTANGPLNNTISDMYIDGRDHTVASPYTIVPHTGRYAVSTSVPFVNTQNASIGGTADSVDYPMTYPENPAVIENYNWGGSFPKTPDEILGYPDGTLKSIAQTGYGGSQYVIDPNKLTWPLKGITYVDLPLNKSLGFDLEKPPAGEVNQGMLIIHAPNTSSRVTGLKASSKDDPPFVGLIVTDYSFHHHLNILGAIMQLSPNLETSSNCNGNKDHWVYYSSEAIINALEIVARASGYKGNNNAGFGSSTAMGGMGQRRYAATAWFE